MMARRFVAALLILAAPALAQAAAPPKGPAGKSVARPAAARDWSQVVMATPEGGFRMGNPNAPVKLVEFGSLTCNHCADFAAQGAPILIRDYVKRGTVSFEFRNLVRDAFDLTAALLSTCTGPRSFFPITDELFATQQGWLGKFGALSQADMQGLEQMDQTARMQRLASIGGLDALAGKFGLPPARVQACLADSKRLEQLMEIRRVAFNQYKLEGTPTFLVNGATIGSANWAQLESHLKPPGRAK